VKDGFEMTIAPVDVYKIRHVQYCLVVVLRLVMVRIKSDKRSSAVRNSQPLQEGSTSRLPLLPLYCQKDDAREANMYTILALIKHIYIRRPAHVQNLCHSSDDTRCDCNQAHNSPQP
jgi:hypothetical protein